MNEKLQGKDWKKLGKMMADNGAPLQIGLYGEDFLSGVTVPGSLRVAMERGGIVMLLSPAKARALADAFDKRNNDPGYKSVEWIPQTLREIADEIDKRISALN